MLNYRFSHDADHRMFVLIGVLLLLDFIDQYLIFSNRMQPKPRCSFSSNWGFACVFGIFLFHPLTAQ